MRKTPVHKGPKRAWGGKGKDHPNKRTNAHPGGRKANPEEVSKRVEFVAKLICPGMKTKHEIHGAMWRKYKIGWHHVDWTYIPRARALLRERSGLTSDEAKVTGLNVLLDVLRTGDNKARLGAEKRLSEIFGYNAPRRHEISGPDGGPIKTIETTSAAISSGRLREIADLIEKEAAEAACKEAADRGFPLINGNGNGNGHSNGHAEEVPNE